MAKIASQNIEVYIRQLLSETLVKDGGPQNRATNENFLEKENFKITNISLSEKPKDK